MFLFYVTNISFQTLSENNVTSLGLQQLTRALKQNRTVTALDLSGTILS